MWCGSGRGYDAGCGGEACGLGLDWTEPEPDAKLDAESGRGCVSLLQNLGCGAHIALLERADKDGVGGVPREGRGRGE